jgi:hypothetical protein
MLVKHVGLLVNSNKTKYMLPLSSPESRQNHYIKTTNRSFENVEKFKYLSMTVTNQNLIREAIKSR